MSVATHNVKVLDHREPFGLLSFAGKILDGDAEHGNGESDARKETLEVSGPVNIGRSNELLLEEPLWVFLVKHIDSLPQIFLLLVGRHIIEADMISETWISTDEVDRVLPACELLS